METLYKLIKGPIYGRETQTNGVSRKNTIVLGREEARQRTFAEVATSLGAEKETNDARGTRSRPRAIK